MQTQRLLEEYLSFGGYPRVVLEDTVEEKRRVINEIYQSYLERDVLLLLGLKKSEEFTSLVRILASQIGNLVNISELANTLGVSSSTIKNYLWYMQKTFLINKVTPYFKGKNQTVLN